jgi:L-ribulose-5-phosphate 3-epimerase UlaE
MIYGRPDDAYRIDYIDTMWEAIHQDEGNTFKIYNTLEDTIKASINKIDKISCIKLNRKDLQKDKENIFKDIPFVSLSARYSRYFYAEKGICWKCKKRPAEESSISGFCTECLEYVKIF